MGGGRRRSGSSGDLAIAAAIAAKSGDDAIQAAVAQVESRDGLQRPEPEPKTSLDVALSALDNEAAVVQWLAAAAFDGDAVDSLERIAAMPDQDIWAMQSWQKLTQTAVLSATEAVRFHGSELTASNHEVRESVRRLLQSCLGSVSSKDQAWLSGEKLIHVLQHFFTAFRPRNERAAKFIGSEARELSNRTLLLASSNDGCIMEVDEFTSELQQTAERILRFCGIRTLSNIEPLRLENEERLPSMGKSNRCHDKVGSNTGDSEERRESSFGGWSNEKENQEPLLSLAVYGPATRNQAQEAPNPASNSDWSLGWHQYDSHGNSNSAQQRRRPRSSKRKRPKSAKKSVGQAAAATAAAGTSSVSLPSLATVGASANKSSRSSSSSSSSGRTSRQSSRNSSRGSSRSSARSGVASSRSGAALGTGTGRGAMSTGRTTGRSSNMGTSRSTSSGISFASLSNVSEADLSKMSATRRRYHEKVSRKKQAKREQNEAQEAAAKEAAHAKQHELERRAFAQLAKLLWKVQHLKALAGHAIYNGLLAGQHSAKSAAVFAQKASASSCMVCARQAADHAAQCSVVRAEWAVAAVVAWQGAVTQASAAVKHANRSARKAHAVWLWGTRRNAAMYARWAAMQARAVRKWAKWWVIWAKRKWAMDSAVVMAMEGLKAAHAASLRAEGQVVLAKQIFETRRVEFAQEAALAAQETSYEAAEFIRKRFDLMWAIVDVVSQAWYKEQDRLRRIREREEYERQKAAYFLAKKAHYGAIKTARAASAEAMAKAHAADWAAFDAAWEIMLCEADVNARFSIYVRTLGEALTVPFTVATHVPIRKIKERVYFVSGQRLEQQRLVYNPGPDNDGGRKGSIYDTPAKEPSYEEYQERQERRQHGNVLKDALTVGESGIQPGETIIIDFLVSTSTESEFEQVGAEGEFGGALGWDYL